MIAQHLNQQKKIVIKQKRELAELFGFETRNKYAIELESGELIGLAVEEGKGLSQFFGRQFLGHWRTFTVRIFDQQKVPLYFANHPFRFLFQRFEAFYHNGEQIGAIQKRFGVLHRKFDIEDAHGTVIMTMKSPIWKVWTFPILKRDREVAFIFKKWSGLFKEALTDSDHFQIEFKSPQLAIKEKELIFMAGIFIDLCYFEKKAS